LSGRGLCDELITRPEESYRLCCVVVCDLETSRMDAPYTYDISRLRVKLVLVRITNIFNVYSFKWKLWKCFNCVHELVMESKCNNMHGERIKKCVYLFSYLLCKTSPTFCFSIPRGKYTCHHTILAWILKKWVILSNSEFAETRNSWYFSTRHAFRIVLCPSSISI